MTSGPGKFREAARPLEGSELPQRPSPRPPRGVRFFHGPWAIVAGLSLAPALTNGFARFAYALVLPAMKQDLGWTYAQAGWINTANAIGYVLGALLALRYVARFGARRLFVLGLVLTMLAMLACGFTRNLWLLSLYRLLAGVGGAPAFIAGGAMASGMFRGDTARNSGPSRSISAAAAWA